MSSSEQQSQQTGTKPAIQHTKSILDDRRIRLLLAIVGAIVAWMVVTIVVQPRHHPDHLQRAGGLYLRFRCLHLPGPEHRQRSG